MLWLPYWARLQAEKAPLASPALTGTPTAPTAAVDTSTTQIATTAFVIGQGYIRADRNLLINGNFAINQRGYVSGAALAAGVYGHDRWKAGASGGDYSFTQNKNDTTITIGASKSLIQVVEDAMVEGGSYVLSWAGTAQARAGINTATPAGAYATSPITINGQSAGTTMSVEFNSGTLATVMLCAGAAASPFRRRPFAAELVLCQRYYERWVHGGGGNHLFVGCGRVDTTTDAKIYAGFEVQKRAIPTFSSSSAGSFLVQHGNSNLAVSALSITTTQDKVELAATIAGATVGFAVNLVNTNPGAFVAFEAEL